MALVKEKNILTILLSLLKVKYTKTFSEKLYEEHPYKDNLLGISKMLSKYGIESIGLKLDSKKESINSLNVPMISYYNSQFIIIYKITTNRIYYIQNREKIEQNLKDFLNNWTKLVLLVEANEKSIEIDYQKHKKEEILSKVQTFSFFSICIISGVNSYIRLHLINNIWASLLIILNIIGLYVCYLLLIKQLHMHNNYADKICLSLKKGNCNSVLDSSAAKLFGILSWSEIGLTFFIFNFSLILFFNSLIIWTVLINTIALPYSIWSIWYQKYRVKQWCLLCIIIQILLWVIFIVNISFQKIQFPNFILSDLLLILCIYIFILFLVRIYSLSINNEKEKKEIIQQLNRLKMEKGVFSLLLNNQPHFEVDRSNSKILFGNTQINRLITIVTNPFCAGCAIIHKKLNTLIEKYNDKICIQYIISSFNPSLEFVDKFLIGVYLFNDRNFTIELYNEWFSKGKFQTRNFLENYDFQIEENEIENEFSKHKSWLNQTNLNITPTVLINGFILPSQYNIEDLEFLIE